MYIVSPFSQPLVREGKIPQMFSKRNVKDRKDPRFAGFLDFGPTV
jgi:hypothetical protein